MVAQTTIVEQSEKSIIQVERAVLSLELPRFVSDRIERVEDMFKTFAENRTRRGDRIKKLWAPRVVDLDHAVREGQHFGRSASLRHVYAGEESRSSRLLRHVSRANDSDEEEEQNVVVVADGDDIAIAGVGGERNGDASDQEDDDDGDEDIVADSAAEWRQAKFTFAGARDDELCFEPGEFIKVHETEGLDGWGMGEVRDSSATDVGAGKVAKFPFNYTEPTACPPELVAAENSAKVATDKGDKGGGEEKKSAATTDAPPVPPPKPTKPVTAAAPGSHTITHDEETNGEMRKVGSAAALRPTSVRPRTASNEGHTHTTSEEPPLPNLNLTGLSLAMPKSVESHSNGASPVPPVRPPSRPGRPAGPSTIDMSSARAVRGAKFLSNLTSTENRPVSMAIAPSPLANETKAVEEANAKDRPVSMS
jgi:hypothetical protein